MNTSKQLSFNVASCYQTNPLEVLKKISSKLKLPIHILLLNLGGDLNIAMAIRTAAVMGCSDVWIVGKRRYDSRPEVGAKNYISVHKIDSIENPKSFFDEKGITPVLIEQHGTPLDNFKFREFDKPICFIMGSEAHGIPAEWLCLDIPRITISQYGMVRSLNVTNACGIVLYEYTKQLKIASSV